MDPSLVKVLTDLPYIVSNQWDPAPVPDHPCWIHYGEVSICRNLTHPIVAAARRIAEDLFPDVDIKWNHLFKIREQAHFHIDQARDTSVIFSIPGNPLRVYIEDENKDAWAVDLIGSGMLVLDAKAVHAARALYKRPWTFFMSMTLNASHEEIENLVYIGLRHDDDLRERGCRVAYPTRVDPMEDLSSLYVTNPQIQYP